jgi:hypothetical protein
MDFLVMCYYSVRKKLDEERLVCLDNLKEVQRRFDFDSYTLLQIRFTLEFL